jgi:2-oxoglutarate ferredoxin oxidoreductase subunit gamma
MLSFAVAITGLVSYEALKDTIAASVPKGTEEKNLAGMEKGFQYGKDLISKST